ncbi:MAG: putative lipid II flippase FtsW [Verrucomicrobiia bacterium]
MARNSSWMLIVSVTVLVALGLVMLMSVGAYTPANKGDATYFVLRQGIYLALGLVAAAVAMRWDYHHWMRAYWIILGLAVFALALCWVPGLGLHVKGSNRWVNLGFTTFQPGEIAKLAVVVFLAAWLGRHQRRAGAFLPCFAIPLLVVGVPAALVLSTQDLGTTALLLALAVLMMFVAGTKLRYLAPVPILGLAGLLGLALFMPQRLGRLQAFLDPEAHQQGAGYQVWQSLIALGSGGLQGLGLGNSVQKFFYLPEPHNDFILAVAGEELGMVCTVAVVLFFLLIAISGGIIAWKAPDPQGALLALGLTALISLQAIINIGVVTGLLPTKGMGLPFISYGGTNLVVVLASIGILLNINRQAVSLRPGPKSNLPALNVRM